MTDVTRTQSRAAWRPWWGRRRVTIAVSLALVLVAAAAALIMVRGVNQQLDDIVRTYAIRNQARILIMQLSDAESGQRGYLLTVDPLYLEPYKAAIAGLDETYEKLLGELHDRPAQYARIQGVRAAIAMKRDELERTIDLADDGRLEDAVAIVRSDEGRVVMEGLRHTIDDFIAEENAALGLRNDAIGVYRNGLVGALLAALSGAAMLAYVLFNRTQNEVSALSRLQGALRDQNVELEARVRTRTAELEEARERAERERQRVETLLQDTNHRIGNSLATVSSLLALQMNRTTSDDVRVALEAARVRVHAIASGHRRLRLGDDLETTRADELLEAVLEDLRPGPASPSAVALNGRFEPLVIPARDATTLGIMVGELITNALKHAFPGPYKGHVTVSLARDPDGVVVLVVEDDGKGMDDSGKGSGLGATIVRQLARQFGGEPHYEARPGGGTIVRLPLPALTTTPDI